MNRMGSTQKNIAHRNTQNYIRGMQIFQTATLRFTACENLSRMTSDWEAQQRFVIGTFRTTMQRVLFMQSELEKNFASYPEERKEH